VEGNEKTVTKWMGQIVASTIERTAGILTYAKNNKEATEKQAIGKDTELVY
jgi:hypothetical protein